jgi:hypothetical protein
VEKEGIAHGRETSCGQEEGTARGRVEETVPRREKELHIEERRDCTLKRGGTA